MSASARLPISSSAPSTSQMLTATHASRTKRRWAKASVTVQSGVRATDAR
ncbi:hypothetical protein [Streptomyces halstedii]